MGKGGGSQQQEVADYRMSLHYGICTGPVVLREIKVDDKVIWSGRMSQPGKIEIRAPNLFGGPKKEGGLDGTVYFLPGFPEQVMPAALAARFGLTPETCPAFRGKATLFFVGRNGGGFLWGSNTPFIRPVKATVERAPVGLTASRSLKNGNANPIHMIYEYLTNTEWGMGAPTYLIDVVNFEDAATKIYNEDFMLSLKWSQQDTVEKFVSEILDHILATFFVNPRTGLLSILLLRDDYVLEELREINQSNARLKSFKRKLFGETINEIVVSWTNPLTEKQETITAQDLANIEIQGSPVSDNRNYYGIRSAELAARVAARDSASASAPLATFEAELDRTQWDLLPGQVVRVNWPRYRLSNAVCRVMNIAYGKAGDPAITVTLMEDIFSVSRPAVVAPPVTQWDGVAVDPEPMQFARVFTLPYFIAEKETATDPSYPAVLAGVLAYQPGGATTSYELTTERLQPNGTLSWESVGTKTLLGRSTMVTPLYAEATSTVAGLPLTGEIRGPQVNGLVVIGDGTDAGSEIALLDAYDGTNWTVRRGVLDTVPRTWAIDTPVWFIPQSASIGDALEVRSVGESPEYKLLTRTSKGVLDIGSAPVVSGLMTARPHAPLRPANVKINGTAFSDVDATGASALNIAWSTRNRLTEDTLVVPWDAGSVTPEYLQMTVVTIFRENGDVMIRWRGLYVESSLAVPIEYLQEERAVFVRVTAERSGIASIQGAGQWVRNIPQVANPSPPPTPQEPPAPPPPTTDPEPTPDPIEGPDGGQFAGMGITAEWSS